ncbi:MAG: SDR family oxidoreductase [Acidimicrobiia bacterium]|nr:SDR family oxidoreductase [Acidimicrobiia bacterium]
MKVLVTGATGYIGGRLVPRLLERGHNVRCMVRDWESLTLDPWRDRVEVATADARDPDSLDAALDGCDAAYFLIHSMKGSGRRFAEEGRRTAENFRDAAHRAGVGRIVYLGGLGSEEDDLSEHLSSRQEVGQVLAAGSTPVTELRAAVIIGSGSLSFEMVRHLTEVLPVVMTPRWVETRCQPIAIRDVLEILVSVLDDPEPVNRLYEIGGPDCLTYQDMMEIYAEVAGLRKRLVIPLPVFSARLSAPLVGLVTPLPVDVARPLIESLQNDVVVGGDSPPGFEPSGLISYREALERALYSVSHSEVETRWSDALTAPGAPLPGDPAWAGAHMLTDRRVANSRARSEDVFWAVTRIGGDVGYYAMNWAWTIRGWIDQLFGGVGLRRGRRHPEELRPGESLDFFRVAEIEPHRGRLLLQAEMKVPGTAWLEWWAEPVDGGSRLTQTAWFVPRGLLGRIYWWGLLPFHAPIWRLMVRRMVGAAERRTAIEDR